MQVRMVGNVIEVELTDDEAAHLKRLGNASRTAVTTIIKRSLDLGMKGLSLMYEGKAPDA